jgi:putative transposase
LSVVRQCELLGLARSSCYYAPAAETAENLALMRRIDELYLERPYFGSRRMADVLSVNRKRVQRLMRRMGIEAIYHKRRTSQPGAGHKIYPYLLRDVEITRRDQVWSSDITYIPMRRGFFYLTAVIDWHSRYVLAWRLSNTLDGSFCHEALDEALSGGRPEIFSRRPNCARGRTAVARKQERLRACPRVKGNRRLISLPASESLSAFAVHALS